MSKPKILIALVVLSGLLAAPALAASPDSIIKDCSSSPTGELQKQYSNGDLRKALKEVNGDVAEYTNCYDAIRNAMRDGSRRGDDGGDGDGTSPGGDPGTGGTGGGSGRCRTSTRTSAPASRAASAWRCAQTPSTGSAARG